MVEQLIAVWGNCFCFHTGFIYFVICIFFKKKERVRYNKANLGNNYNLQEGKGRIDLNINRGLEEWISNHLETSDPNPTA